MNAPIRTATDNVVHLSFREEILRSQEITHAARDLEMQLARNDELLESARDSLSAMQMLGWWIGGAFLLVCCFVVIVLTAP